MYLHIDGYKFIIEISYSSFLYRFFFSLIHTGLLSDQNSFRNPELRFSLTYL